ncbi:PREDICTED: uncharacterized protein C12orf40 homolog isoform X2 [Lepidothrix coronata]|uniref:Uncharacterized protein C12orf40 homolog isoform X2 n=1 Tax=Lepidothrix coronata TaxID=321398 RepID=A0A6J0GZ09_9PASS|nr:PREDICTED: uncharacterized protein C12orf40 homolog isoform X2 [Lepidothrix coronata]
METWSRIILKQERRKQKEYFEKKKLKSKMKLLEVSSPKSSAVSLDLLNLYVVNQISTKKDNTENVRKPVHVDIIEDVKKLPGRHNLELPTSPLHTQHKSNLDDLQNRLQKQVLDSRRQHLSEKVKYQHNGFQSSSCTQLPEEKFNTNLMGDIWEQTYEEKLQKQPGNIPNQDSWNTKPPSQCIFRKSDTVLQELFEPFHRLDPMNSARKNPVIMTSNESENCEGIKAPLFDFVKEAAELKAPQVGSGCSFLALFEDESQPIYNNPSTKHFNLFVNQSSTDIFFIHSDVRNQMTDRNYPYNTRKAYPAINKKKSSVDRHLEGIFTTPELVFLKSNNDSSASYKETSGLHKTNLQNFNEGQHYFIPCEKKEKHANLEKIETFAYHHDQQINLKENVQNYSRKKRDDESMKETAWRQNQLFGFEEFTIAREKESKFGASSNLHEMEKIMESPLSSQSYSYSPRQTESYLSCSPDTCLAMWNYSSMTVGRCSSFVYSCLTLHACKAEGFDTRCFQPFLNTKTSWRCEEEDTAKKTEYLNEQSLKTHDANLSASREAPKSFHTRTVPLQPSSNLSREEANILQDKGLMFCTIEDKNKNHAAPSEGSSSHRALKREHVTRSTRCDVWSQTERSVTEVEKADVATQCGTLRVCSCGGSLPAARSPVGVPPPRTAGTAGEDELPAQEIPQPAGAGSAAGTAALPSEAEYLSLAGKRTLEVLNYIDKMKERDKQ